MSRPPDKIEVPDTVRLRRIDPSRARLGPHPFDGGIKYYAARREADLSARTLEEDTRKLRYFGRVFEGLRKAGAIDSTDPRRFGKQHIEEFLIWMRGRGIGTCTQSKYIQILDRYLTVFGNLIIVEIRRRKSVRLPRDGGPDTIRALTAPELQAVFDAAEHLGGWRGSVMRGYIALAFGTACRPNEIMSALVHDVDTEKHTFYVRNPKGLGNWGIPQKVRIIRADMWPKIGRFLEERKKLLDGMNVDTEYLFFNRSTLRPYTANGMHAIKGRLEKMAGVEFELKVFRATYASLTLESDLSLIKAVSLQLRHSSVSMTEKYYARINKDREIQRSLGDRWKDNPIRRSRFTSFS